MVDRIRAELHDLRFALDSWRGNFWFFPSIIGLATLIMFFVVIWIDRIYSLGTDFDSPYYLIHRPESARSVLSTIGAAIGTIATVVFSISILTLQLASSEYTPRLLRSFTKSTVSQITLGTFVATVAFSILTIGVVREQGPNQDAFVPDIAINIAKLMALASLGLLVFFISHIAVLISPSHIIRTTCWHTIEAYKAFIEKLAGTDAPPLLSSQEGVVIAVKSRRSGYIQRIRSAKLLFAATRLSKYTEISPRLVAQVTIGDYVKAGDTLMELTTESPPDETTEKDIRDAFTIGQTRLPEEDYRYGINELHSIALRRIKQSDPDTADECVSALVEVWLRLMELPPDSPNRWLEMEHEDVYLAFPPVDLDTQHAHALRAIQERALETTLIDLASGVHEGVCTIVREAASKRKAHTFAKAWPLLTWSTYQLIAATDYEEMLARIIRALDPLRTSILDHCPEKWQELLETIEKASSVKGTTEYFRDFLAHQ